MKSGRVSSTISVIFRARWFWCITAMMTWLPQRSSVGCKSPTPFTNTWWSMKSPRWGAVSPMPRSTSRSRMRPRAQSIFSSRHERDIFATFFNTSKCIKNKYERRFTLQGLCLKKQVEGLKKEKLQECLSLIHELILLGLILICN